MSTRAMQPCPQWLRTENPVVFKVPPMEFQEVAPKSSGCNENQDYFWQVGLLMSCLFVCFSILRETMISREPKCLAAIRLDASQRLRITFAPIGLLWGIDRITCFSKLILCNLEVWRLCSSASEGTSRGDTLCVSSLNIWTLKQMFLWLTTGQCEVYWKSCSSTGSTWEEKPTSCPATGKL